MGQSKLPPVAPPRFKVGDWAIQVRGDVRVPVRILEDVGPVGHRRMRYYRYLRPVQFSDPVESETSEDGLEPARPDEIPAAAG